MSRPLNLLLAGAGFMGREHLKAARDLPAALFVGVMDSNAALAEKLGAEYGLPAFADLAAAVRQTRPAAVDICVPTPFHRPLVEQCARHRLHVLCEKPIARTLEDARAIQQVAAQAGIRVMVAQVIRFWPEYRFIRKAVKAGTYGRILAVDCKRLSAPPAWNSWMLDARKGGGCAVDLQIHDLDFVYQLLGKPREIRAVGRKFQGTINAAVNQLVYPEPIPVTVEASSLMPPSYPFRMFFKIEFEQAVAEMDFWRPKGQRLKLFPAQGEAFFPTLELKDAYREEIDYFARQILTGAPFAEVPLEDSILALELCLASEQAGLTGQPVVL